MQASGETKGTRAFLPAPPRDKMLESPGTYQGERASLDSCARASWAGLALPGGGLQLRLRLGVPHSLNNLRIAEFRRTNAHAGGRRSRLPPKPVTAVRMLLAISSPILVPSWGKSNCKTAKRNCRLATETSSSCTITRSSHK